MKKKVSNEQQLQISSFIKDPGSLKLLILAGTNIKHIELSTVAKCTSLIKLDLSSNFLNDIPLKFHGFPHMKILYLHDNQLTQIQIKGTQLQYISLFKNPIKPAQYRRPLIQNNSKLLGIDFNAVTAKQRFSNASVLPIYSEIKWPIVQISTNLQHQDDYLNLLKAQIFVISNVHKRTVKIQIIQSTFQGIIFSNRYKSSIFSGINGSMILPSVIKAVSKWKEFTSLKKKLRKILQKKGKQILLSNQIQRNRLQRSQQVSQVLDCFLQSVRKKMKVRAVLQRQSRSYRAFIPARKQLQRQYLDFNQKRDYQKNPAKLYFRYSQLDILSKVCLYAKKLFFKQKDYDLCDEFNNFFRQTNRNFYILRKNQYLTNERSWLLNSIHQTSGYVLRQIGVDRKHFLYSKKGHKQIKVKNINKLKDLNKLKQQMIPNDRKLENLFQRYDKLIEYQVLNWKILKNLLKIIRYINAGNSQSIIMTQTAYFQTQVIFQEQLKSNKKTRFHIGLEFFIKRVIAANRIQRFWRRKMAKNTKINTIQLIRKKRAQNLISKWIRNIIFQHRLSSLKTTSYYSSIWKDKQVYFHLDVYMNMPNPVNNLRFLEKPQNKNNFYDKLHKNTEVQIVYNCGRGWVKILYPTAKQAKQAQIYFHKYSYCYLQGFFLRLFNQNQINNTGLIQRYQRLIPHLFKIQVNPPIKLSAEQKNTKTILDIDNNQPYFIWSEVNSLQHFTKFEGKDRYNTNVSIFIYNKHKRPLKVSCQFYWVNLDSLYVNRKIKHRQKAHSLNNNKNINPSTIKKPNAKTFNLRQNEGDLSLLQLQYSLNNGSNKNKPLYDLNNSKLHSKVKNQRIKQQRERQINNSVDKIGNLRRNSLGSRNDSKGKSHRSRIISDGMFQKLSQTLNIRGK